MTLLSLEWAYYRVNGSQVAHLCPPRILEQSRTACNRLPLAGARLEAAIGLLTAVERCARCSQKDGDAA